MDCTCKVYPSAQKLKTITTTLYCPEEGCSSIFSSGSNLNLHLVKTHKKQNLKRADNFIRQYYCPETKCVYNEKLFFKTMKLLKQHYLKVHAEKKYICEKCQRGFPTTSAQKSHTDYCGVVFKCTDCSVAYPCYETLKTHCRRKKHTVVEKTAFKTVEISYTFPQKITSASDTRIIVKTRTLFPKTSNLAMFIIPFTNTKTCVVERSTQTDISSSLLKSENKDNAGNKKLQICVETQTDTDCVIQKSASENFGILEEIPGKTSIKTQTCPIDYKTSSCNTKTTLSDSEYCEAPTISRNSSGTQTSASVENDFLYFTQASSDSNINFDFEPKESLSAFDSTFFNCNSETQTDLFGNEFFNDCEYYSNMCTQTCDDVFLGELGLNNSHTQTAFDDVVRSVESQTMFSQNRKVLLNCRDMANMETQTDLECKQMLEEINT